MSHLVTGGISHLVTGGISHLVTDGISHLFTGGIGHLVTGGISHLVTGGMSHLVTGGISHLVTGGGGARNLVPHGEDARGGLGLSPARRARERHGDQRVLRGVVIRVRVWGLGLGGKANICHTVWAPPDAGNVTGRSASCVPVRRG